MIKVAFIGAGSLAFTRGLIKDLLCIPEFRDGMEFTLMDIDTRNLNVTLQLVKRDMAANGSTSTIKATTNRREALKGAKYVFCTARVGGLTAMEPDIEIPMKYGVDQCVGDTLCAGGIMYAQRSIPFLLDCMRESAEIGHPDCYYLNYQNPMAMNTWACEKYGYGVRFVGLCHGVQGDHYEVAEALGVDRKDLECKVAGINHQTWFLKVLHKGVDVTKDVPAAFLNHPKYSQIEKVRVDVAQRFGYYSTESSGHYSEYVPWYRKRPDDLKNWVDLSSWIQGESAGHLRCCREYRAWILEDLPNMLKAPAWNYEQGNRGNEHGAYIVEAMETGRVYRGWFNVRNDGCVTNLSKDAIVEIQGFVDRLGIHKVYVGEIPAACASVCEASISTQRLAAEAAVHGDIDMLRQAMLLDPLTSAVCNPPEIWQMTDELLVAEARWLPQYKKAIMGARRRLKKSRIPIRPYTGAIRLKEKTVADMKREAELQRKLTLATDKTRVEREANAGRRKKRIGRAA